MSLLNEDPPQRTYELAAPVKRSCIQGELTGRWRVRTNWRGKLIVQVEFYAQNFDQQQYHETFRYIPNAPGRSVLNVQRGWRDAQAFDLSTVFGGEQLNFSS